MARYALPGETSRLFDVFPIEGYSGPLERHHDDRPDVIDLPAKAGTPIRSVKTGTVVAVQTEGAGGNAVIIQDDDGKMHYYAHMLQRPNLRPGQRVEEGQTIGAVGSTGTSTGPHLHYGAPRGATGPAADVRTYLEGLMATAPGRNPNPYNNAPGTPTGEAGLEGPGFQGGGGGAPLDPPVPGNEALPPGYVRVPNGTETVYDPSAPGGVRTVPRYSIVPDRSYLGPQQPAQRAPAYPWERDDAYSQIDAREANTEINRGRLDLDRDRLALDRQIQQGKLELERLITLEGSWYQKQQVAIQNRQQDEVERATRMLEAIRERQTQVMEARQRLDEQKVQLDAALGYAKSAREDLSVNLDRAKIFGRDVDGMITGNPGEITAEERQQRFNNLQTGSLNVERMLDRNRSDERYRVELGLKLREQAREEARDPFSFRVAALNPGFANPVMNAGGVSRAAALSGGVQSLPSMQRMQALSPRQQQAWGASVLSQGDDPNEVLNRAARVSALSAPPPMVQTAAPVVRSRRVV